MKAELRFFHCGDQLRNTLAAEIAEVESVVSNVSWLSSFQYIDKGITHEHQTGYNRAFSKEFERLGWERSPVLRREPKLIGDFRKGLVFVEIQFGNSATLCPFFLGYYWPLEVKYHLRQSTDPDRDPIIMKRIRRLMKAGTISPGETLQNFKHRMPEEHKALLDRIEREAFNDVIPRFHIVRGTPIVPPILTFAGKPGKAGDKIELTNGGRQFCIENKRLIDYVAVSGWVRFTEQFTSASKLHDKIENNKKRGTVLQYREPFKIIQHGRCFYDDSHDMSLSEVDHVLPWSFVLEDKTWNLVLACRKCNNVKRDRLTNVDAIERLCSRNEKIAKGYASAESAFLRHFSEWHSRDLSSHIRGLYDQAVADGFPEWSQGRSALP